MKLENKAKLLVIFRQAEAYTSDACVEYSIQSMANVELPASSFAVSFSFEVKGYQIRFSH